MDTLLTIALGIGLAAACGFRIFVPLLVINLAAQSGRVELAGGFEWMGSTPALIVFGTATVLEILAYYVPFVDNLLDTVATPSAVVAGIIATASQVGDMDPMLTWSVAIIGGGGAAGAVQGVTAVTRQISSLATAGFGNPIFSTLELGGSLVMTALAIFMPLLAVFALLLLVMFMAKRFFFTEQPPEVAA
ncbi:MAG: DUF4126 domain-containing protein [Acidobacteriota bacterium]